MWDQVCVLHLKLCVGEKWKCVGSLLRETLFVWICLQWKPDIFSKKNLISVFLHNFYLPASSINFSIPSSHVHFYFYLTLKVASSPSSLSSSLHICGVYSLYLPLCLMSFLSLSFSPFVFHFSPHVVKMLLKWTFVCACVCVCFMQVNTPAL